MHGHNKTIEVVREWVIKAENDLTNADHTLKLKENAPRTQSVSMHSKRLKNISKHCLFTRILISGKPMISVNL